MARIFMGINLGSPLFRNGDTPMMKCPPHLFWKFFVGCLVIPMVLSSCLSDSGNNPTPRLESPTSPTSISLPTQTALPEATPTNTPTASPTTTSTPTNTATTIPTATKEVKITRETVHQISKIGRTFPSGEQFGEFAPVTQVIFQTDRTLVARVTGNEYANGIAVKDFESQQLITTLVDEQDVDYEYLIASPDSRLLASVSPTAEKIVVWDMEALQKVMALNFSGVISQYTYTNVVQLTGSFSFDNRWLAVSGCVELGAPPDPVYPTRFCQTAKTFIYDLETGTITQELSNYQITTGDSTFSPDNQFLVLAGVGTQGGSLIIWDMFKAELITEIIEGDVFGSMAFTPAGDALLTFNTVSVFYAPSKLQLWDTSNWELVAEYEVSWSTRCLTFIPNTDLIAMSDTGDGGVVLYDLDTQQSYREERPIGKVIEIFASPDQRYLYILTQYLGLEKWGIP